jgi:hypothetical protein
VHCSRLLRPATRLVSFSGKALTAAAGPPGALNRVMGVLVSPCILHAIPASRPSHNLMPCPASLRYCTVSYAPPPLLLECSHTACGESLTPGEPVSAPHISRLQRQLYYLARSLPRCGNAQEREMALTGIGRGGARRRSIRLATTKAGCLSMF